VYRDLEQKLFADYGVEVHEHVVNVEEPGTSVRVLEIGSGKPIVFIHGSPNSAATWVPLAAELAGRRCLLLERPGAGLSTPIDRWTDHRTESASIVGAVTDHFDLDRADLVGSSFGGLYAYNFALIRPERVGKLVLMGSPGGPSVLGMPTIFRFLSLPLPKFMVDRALRPDPNEARKMFAEIGHRAALDRDLIPAVVFEWYSALLRHTDTVEHLLGEVRAIANPLGYRPAARLDDTVLARLTSPILYLWGDQDAFAGPDKADALAALTSKAQIEHFEGFGHLPWYDNPALIAERTEDFLSAPEDMSP
jgi:pimeloyl-ACP methyl ester carboxylesterase